MVNNLKFLILCLLSLLGQSQSEMRSNLNEAQQMAYLITSLDFYGANMKIKEFNITTEKMSEVVNIIYKNYTENFYVLIEFACCTRIEITYAILIGLWDEIQVKNQMEFDKMLDIHKTFKEEIIDQSWVNETVKSKSIEICKEKIQPKIIESFAEGMILAISIKGNVNDTNNAQIAFKNMVDSVRDMEESILNEIFCKVIDIVRHKIADTEMLLFTIFNYFYEVSEQATAMICISDFVQARKISQNDIPTIAHYMSQLTLRVGYTFLPREQLNQTETIIENLPKSVKNLYFSESVCLWNTGYKEYIYLSETLENPDRRYVFTKGLSTIIPESKWYAMPLGKSKFYFQNEKHHGEYMYASFYEDIATYRKYGKYSFVGNYHNVFTWVAGNVVNKKFIWRIQILGNGEKVYIRNEHFNELLCLSTKTYEKNKRFVLTSKNELGENDCHWIIEKC